MNTEAITPSTILIVDDDPEVLASFQIWLDGEGFRTFTASDSAGALQIIENDPIEVALLDFRLATENGLEVAEMIQAVDDNIKLVIITGYPSHDTAVKSIKAGLFDYLSKGASNETILETINKAIQAREREMIGKGEAFPRKDVLKFIVIGRHSLIKERLRNFSDNFPAFKLVKTYNSLEAMENADYIPDTDIAMICCTCCLQEFENCFCFFERLYRLIPSVKPVIFNENFTDNQKVDLIRVGIKGFFSIDLDSNKLEKAFHLIKKGEMWVSRKLVNLAVPSGPEFLKNYLNNNDSYDLSCREKEILKAMVMGLKNKQIADKLFISENTVKTHINKIYRKFSVENRAQAILIALENKVL